MTILTLIFILLAAGISCTPKPAPQPALAPEAAPVATAPPEAAKPKVTAPVPPALPDTWLAELKERIRNVDYRPHTESIWQKAEPGVTFDRFDALQTQSSSNAKVQYKSGSRLDISASTLIVFDQDPGLNKKRSEDRVIVKSGELTGTTRTELWVFTNAGLVQIKAPKDKKQMAQAKISIQDGKKLNVKISAGTADLFYAKNNQYQKLQMAANSDFEIISQTALFADAAKPAVDEAKINEITTAVSQVTKATRAELFLDSPEEGSSVSTAAVDVKGRLTAPGAKLLINGQFTTPDENLNFSRSVKLTEGTNLIVLQLIRTDGSVEFLRRNVKMKAGP